MKTCFIFLLLCIVNAGLGCITITVNPTCKKMREKCDNGLLGLGILNKCCGRNIPAQFFFNLCFFSEGLKCDDDPKMKICVPDKKSRGKKQTSTGTFKTSTRKLCMHLIFIRYWVWRNDKDAKNRLCCLWLWRRWRTDLGRGSRVWGRSFIFGFCKIFLWYVFRSSLLPTCLMLLFQRRLTSPGSTWTVTGPSSWRSGGRRFPAENTSKGELTPDKNFRGKIH